MTPAPRRTAPICAAAVVLLSAAGVLAETEATGDALTVERARLLVDELAPRVEMLRGLRFKRAVPFEVVGDSALRDHALARLREFEQEEHLDSVQQVYRLLGLMPDDAGLIELLLGAMEEQVGGFYDPGRGAYYLMEDVPRESAPIFTAHELTHALEDQHFDLDARLRETIDDDDRTLARGAVHEGSATILMSVYMTGAVSRGELDRAALEQLARSEAGRARKLHALPDVLVRQLIGPYVLGVVFLSGGDLATLAQGYPGDAIDRALRDGPTSSEQILHPEKYWDPEQRDEPRPVRIAGARRVLGRGWKLAGSGVLGELTLGPLVGASTPKDPRPGGMSDPAAWTNAAASGWDGDRWQLWRRKGRAVLLLATEWDTTDDAAEFASALSNRDGIAWRREGERVALVAGDAGEKTGRLLERLLR